MAEELEVKDVTQPEGAEQAPEAPPAPEQTPPAQPEAKKEKKEFLLPVLTALLLLLGIGEAVFWGAYGLNAYRKELAMQQYERQQAALAEEREAQGIVGGSAYGPRLKVENGVVTWRAEELSQEGGSVSGGGSGGPGSGGGQTSAGQEGQSVFYVPTIPYALADMGEDSQSGLPADGTPGGDAA